MMVFTTVRSVGGGGNWPRRAVDCTAAVKATARRHPQDCMPDETRADVANKCVVAFPAGQGTDRFQNGSNAQTVTRETLTTLLCGVAGKPPAASVRAFTVSAEKKSSRSAWSYLFIITSYWGWPHRWQANAWGGCELWSLSVSSFRHSGDHFALLIRRFALGLKYHHNQQEIRIDEGEHSYAAHCTGSDHRGSCRTRSALNTA